MIYILVILYFGAPSLIIQGAYWELDQCEVVAESLTNDLTIAVCQRFPVTMAVLDRVVT